MSHPPPHPSRPDDMMNLSFSDGMNMDVISESMNFLVNPSPVSHSVPPRSLSSHQSNRPMPSEENLALFDAYAAQFGIPRNTNSNGHVSGPSGLNSSAAGALETGSSKFSSVEEYANLMGVKLEQPSDQGYSSRTPSHNANEVEAMLKNSGQSGNLTTMTLPPGIGNGVNRPTNHVNFNFSAPMAMDNHMMQSPVQKNVLSTPMSTSMDMNKAIPSSGAVGSQTLAPEMLQSMIQNNLQNASQVPLNNWGMSPHWSNNSPLTSADHEAMTKADKSRERNRDHSRKSRLRKKVYVENLKQEVKQLGIYREICEECLDLIAVITTEPSANFTFASRGYSRTLGLDHIEIVAQNKSFFDFIHPDDREQVKEGMKRVSAFGEFSRIKYRVQSIDGEYFPADTSARITEKGMICITRVDKQSFVAEPKK